MDITNFYNYGTMNQVEPGATQINNYYGDKPDEESTEEPAEVPECLCTEEANELWEIAQEEGWVGEDLQPKGLSRPDAALLAARMGKLLGIEGWRPFERLWHRKNMRQDYGKTQYNQKTEDFEKKLKRRLQ